MELSLGEDITYNLEGSLAALVSQLKPSDPVAFEHGYEVESHSQIATDTNVSLIPNKSGAIDISVIEGVQQEYGEDLECDFSSLVSPRCSVLPQNEGHASFSVDKSHTSAYVGAVTRRSTREPDKSGLLESPRDTFGEFSLLASNEEEEERISQMASGNAIIAAPTNLMNRLRNLNAGARNNSLLQAGTPSVGGAESRMSIGIKRQSMIQTTCNLNSSINMSVMYAVPSTSVKSSKKAKLAGESPQPVTEEQASSPTPSMSHVYGGSSPSSIHFKSNPMRTVELKAATSVFEPVLLTQAELVDEMEVIDECMEDSFQETELLESEMNDSITDHAAAQLIMRQKLTSYFGAVQTVKTVLSNYCAEVQTVLKESMSNNIGTAYVDSVLSQVPTAGLLKAWDLGTHENESFLQHTLSVYPDCYKHQRMTYSAQNADQLWVNMCAASVISLTAGLHASNAQTADMFYNKALNRAPGRASHHRSSKNASVTSLQQNQLVQVQDKLAETELLIDIINKLTFCRVTTFQSSCVKITAMLSPTVDVTLVFNLDKESDGDSSVKLVVAGIEVDLVVVQDKNTPKVVSAQNLFVSAYFASVMCADDCEGCLSSVTLNAVEEPYHIPPLLHKVNGAIADLRMILRKLPALNSDGWKFVVAKTSAQEGLFKVIVAVPSIACHVHVPVNVLVQAHRNSMVCMQATLDQSRISVMHSDSAAQVPTDQAQVAVQLLESRLSQ
mmetsp:Transcript_72840/g.142871  ORF Transcript_72840/g.142871 Transcript_72840/m.142871 type:complete len:727 (+) Transcript_72840:861-3041(+)